MIDQFCLLGKTCKTHSSKHFLWNHTTELSSYLLSATAVASRRWCQLLSFLLQSSFGRWAIFQDWAPRDGCRKEEAGECRQPGIWEVSFPRARCFRMKEQAPTRFPYNHAIAQSQRGRHRIHPKEDPRGAFGWVAETTYLFNTTNRPLGWQKE